MKKTALFLLLSACLASCSKSNGNQYEVKMDRFTFEKVNEVIREKVMTSGEAEHGNLVSSVSSAFLNTPYKGNTLVGSADTNEILVADFNGVDCFTLIDYVEALTRAKDYKSFINKLVETRYAYGNVAYFSRKHFFTDWSSVAPYNATDVTRKISSDYVRVHKNLNAKADGGEYIPNLGIIPREIHYIPGHAIDAAVLAKLKSGDYIGVYSQLPGLDVSHTGIVVKKEGKVWLRNASSLASNMKVVDSPFVEYMTSKPGFIVLRAD